MNPSPMPPPDKDKEADDRSLVPRPKGEIAKAGEEVKKRELWDRILRDLEEVDRQADYGSACYERGKVAFDKHDYDQAIEEFSEAIRQEPDFSWAWANRGHCYFEKGDYDRAFVDFTEHISLKPNAFSWGFRGGAYYLKGDYDQAISDFNEAIHLARGGKFGRQPSGSSFSIKTRNRLLSRIYEGRADACEAVTDYGQAIKDYSEAIRLDSDYPGSAARARFLWRQRGRVHQELGNTDAAEADFRKAREVNPEWTD